MIVAYWGHTLCARCADALGRVGGELDQRGNWPPVPPELRQEGTE